jgi:uncharacterized SAM-binding protein YcdF (DUF218 family)
MRRRVIRSVRLLFGSTGFTLEKSTPERFTNGGNARIVITSLGFVTSLPSLSTKGVVMKQFRLAALLLCSTASSGCYLTTQGRPDTANNVAVQQILPAAIVLAVIFVIIGVSVALQTENKERKDAALAIAGTATAVFLLLLG